MIRRTVRGLIRVVGVLTVLVVTGAGAFLWRLSQGPIALDPLLPLVEQALGNADRRITVTMGGLVLGWTDDDGDGHSTLDLRALRVVATSAEGAPLAAVPELGISFSALEAVRGRLVPTRFTAVRPQITAVRHPDGSIGFDLRDDASNPEPEAGTPLAQDALAALGAPPDAAHPLGLLRTLEMVGAELTVRNEALGLTWRASRADVSLRRDAAGIHGRGRLVLDLGGPGATVAADAVYRRADGTTTLGLSVEGLEPSRLAALAPDLAPLAGIAVPVSGRVEADFDPAFFPTGLRFDVSTGAGAVMLPQRPDHPLAVRRASLRGSLDLATRRLAVDQGVVETADGNRLALSAALQDGGNRPLTGEAKVDVTAGGATATLRATAVAHEDGSLVMAEVAGLDPSRLATLDPGLAPLAAAAVPVTGKLRVTLGPEHQFRRLAVDLAAGPGRVTLPERFDAPVAIVHATLRGESGADGRDARIDTLSVALGHENGPVLTATAALAPAESGGASLSGTARLVNLPFDDLHRYWPKGVSGNARDWVTANLSRGLVSEATVAMAGGLAGGGGLRLDTLEGAITAGGADVAYFRPLPPVTGVEAVDVRFDQRRFTIRTRGGQVNDVKVGETDIVLDDLDTDNEKIAIKVPLEGPVRSILTILDSPPLGYPKKLDLDPRRTAGTVDGVLDIRFPLLADLPMDAIQVKAEARLKGAAVEKVAAGLDASDGTLALDLDMKGMGIKGTARLDGIPSTVEWRESFEDQPKGPRTRVAVKARADASALARKLFDPAPYATGPLAADLVFTIDAQRRYGMTVALDLTQTTLTLDELGWSKPAGSTGTARFKVDFQKDRVTRLSGLTAEGVGFKVAGGVEFAPGTSALSRVVLSDVTLGRSILRGDVKVRGDGGYAFTLSGPVLDAAPALKDRDDGKGGTPPDPAPRRRPVEIQGSFDRVMFGEWRQLNRLTATARNDGNAWTFLDIKADAGGPNGAVSLRFAPEKGRHTLRLQAADLGRALRMTDLNDRVRDGALLITGTTEGAAADSPLVGRIAMTDYRLVDTPVLARILNAMSLAGLVDLLGGEGISFGKLDGAFRKEGRLVTLKDVRTSGSALGVTLEGQLDTKTDVANLRGTIVPVYGLNRLIGQIPILGDLLSGGEGQGIFSATWHVMGPVGDPQVTVNPLAVLAPGFLRNLFFLGDGEGASSPPPQPRGGDHAR